MTWPTSAHLKEVSGIFVDVVVLLGAAAAVVKLRLFNLLGYRWRSELTCTHYDLPNSSVIFTADYTIFNTGERPLIVSEVTIDLVAARQEGALLRPDHEKNYARHVMRMTHDPSDRRIHSIQPGERTIFPIRVKLPSMDDAVFVMCKAFFEGKQGSTSWSGFYVKSPAKTGSLSPADNKLQALALQIAEEG